MKARGIAAGLVWLAGAAAAEAAGPEAWLAAEVDRLNAGRRGSPEVTAAAFVDRAVDLPAFAELCFGDYVEDSLAEVEDSFGRIFLAVGADIAPGGAATLADVAAAIAVTEEAWRRGVIFMQPWGATQAPADGGP